MRKIGNITYICTMKRHGKSGRIVIDVEPKLKHKLYEALETSGDTLKDWFVREAADFTYGVKNNPASNGELSKEPSLIRLSKKNKAEVEKTFSVVSMFSGCGGLDLGFIGGFEIFGRQYESNPFEIVWANDLNQYACKTYKRNIGHEIHEGDVWNFIKTLPKSADVVMS